MYSPADLPSSTRAAPAKKRRLSAQTGSSSFAYDSGLPTFCDSSSASSSAWSSIAAASLSSASARSPGVVSSHAGSAFLAAWTARSTSSAVAAGTSAITSPVAGFRTSIVSPPAESTHSPPIKFWCFEIVVLICPPWLASSLHRGHLGGLRRSSDRNAASQNARVACQALADRHRHDRQQDDRERHDVHNRELLSLTQ